MSAHVTTHAIVLFFSMRVCFAKKICVRACLFLHPEGSRCAKLYGSGSEKFFDKQPLLSLLRSHPERDIEVKR
jgi:hypothetical protein